VFPPLDGIDIEKVLFDLAAGKEHIILPGESDRVQTGIREDDPPGDVVKHQPPLPELPEWVSATRFHTDQVNVVDLCQHVLRFVMAGHEGIFLKVSRAGHADSRLPELFYGLGGRWECIVSV